MFWLSVSFSSWLLSRRYTLISCCKRLYIVIDRILRPTTFWPLLLSLDLRNLARRLDSDDIFVLLIGREKARKSLSSAAPPWPSSVNVNENNRFDCSIWSNNDFYFIILSWLCWFDQWPPLLHHRTLVYINCGGAWGGSGDARITSSCNYLLGSLTLLLP